MDLTHCTWPYYKMTRKHKMLLNTKTKNVGHLMKLMSRIRFSTSGPLHGDLSNAYPENPISFSKSPSGCGLRHEQVLTSFEIIYFPYVPVICYSNDGPGDFYYILYPNEIYFILLSITNVAYCLL